MLLLSLVFFYIYISQGSVEMQFWYGGVYNNHIIADCPQNVQVTHSVCLSESLSVSAEASWVKKVGGARSCNSPAYPGNFQLNSNRQLQISFYGCSSF